MIGDAAAEAGTTAAMTYDRLASVAETKGLDESACQIFLPAAIFAGAHGLGWDDTLWYSLFAGLGNVVGAVVFVATSYWYLFLEDGQADDAGR